MNSTEAYRGVRGTDYWVRNMARLEQEAPLRRLAIRQLIPPYLRMMTWLEVGCGRGHNMFAGDIGVDVDERQLRFLPPHKTGIIASATAIPIPSSHFPVVFCVGLLMHLPPGEWQLALGEMARIATQFVIIGEHLALAEQPLDHPHWQGMLWERPYAHPLLSLQHMTHLQPFDPSVTFVVFEKVKVE